MIPKHLIPELETGCTSWIVVGRFSGELVGEYSRLSDIERLDPDICLVVTKYQWLGAINQVCAINPQLVETIH